MTQEFHISVTPVGNDEYLVRTERVAPGVPLAEEQVRWPVESWLAQARPLMNDPLIGLLQGNYPNPMDFHQATLGGDPTGSQPPLSLVELGQQLYSSLFQGMLRDSWVTAQGIAQHRNEVLRLRIGLKGSRLPRLPWEVLYDNDIPAEKPRSGGLATAPRPLATGTHIIFSRFQPGTRLATGSLTARTEPNQPLRVLMVIAAPSDRERLELEREARQLQQELSNQQNQGGDRLAGSPPDIQLTILNQPGREQLTEALEQGHYQVLHYAGHSDLGADGGSLYLVNERTGLTEILSGDDLAGLLVNNGIRLAVFNSCRGAYTAASDAGVENERNLAEALVGRGIPAVLAMAEQIPDNVALTLTWLFYRNLKLGYPIDLSLSRARQGLISAYGSHQLYWALPILYLHPEFDGYLTLGDRSSENPADRLILLPQAYSAFPVLTPEEVVSPLSSLAAAEAAEQTVETTASLPQAGRDRPESGGWTEDINTLDETYEEDAQLVADLLRQLTPDPDYADAAGWDANDIEVTAVDAQTLADAPRPNRSPHATPTEPHPTRSSHSRPQVPLNPAHNPGSTPSSEAAIVSTSTRTEIAPQPEAEASRRPALVPVLGVVGAVAIALLGIWSWTQLETGIVVPLPGNGTISLGGAKDLQTADLDEVRQVAINHLTQGRLTEGEQAIGILLDRQALQEAGEALRAVPAEVDTPGINFLWGRLAWQGLETGNPIYKLEDAREYWEQAVEADPNNPEYLEALGFAYYAENNPIRAMQTWVQALNQFENQIPIAQSTSDESLQSAPEVNPEMLNTYAGIALALWKSSAGQPYTQRENLTRKAAKIHQMVEQSDPNRFKPQVLSRNWLWSRSAIRDWQALSQVQF